MRYFKRFITLKEQLIQDCAFDGVSLSILTPRNIPWRFNGDPSTRAKLETSLNLAFSIDDDGVSFPATLTVDNNFDRTANRLPHPIVAKLTIVSPATRVGGDSRERDDQKPHNEAKPTARRTQSDVDSNEPVSAKKKSKGNGLSNKPDKSETTASNSREKDVLLLNDLFQRFGRVHGSVVVKVKSGASTEDVEIVRFGDVPQS